MKRPSGHWPGRHALIFFIKNVSDFNSQSELIFQKIVIDPRIRNYVAGKSIIII